MTRGTSVELRDYIEVLRRRWRSVLAPVVLATLAAATLSALATPVYTSTASLFFSLQNGDSANELAQGATFTQAQMASYATLADTHTVLAPVVTELGLPGDVGDLARQVEVSAPSDTVVLELSVTDPSPVQAARIAGAVATQLQAAVAEVAPRSADDNATVRSTVVAPAEVPTSPSSPDTALNTTAGLLLGIVLGVLLALLREALDTRVRGTRQLRALTAAPVLGNLTLDAASASGLVLEDSPRSPQAELYRTLRTNIQFLQLGGRPLSAVVTSSLPAEGKSTVALNLSLALAEVSARVLLVDADLRRPTVADRLAVEGDAGLSTVLVGRAAFDDVVQEWGPHGLHVLTSGVVPPNPAELLSSPAMASLAAELSTRYDVVVWDAPPLLPVTDAQLLARHVDGVVLVAGSRTVRKAQFAEALESLQRVEARLLGVVLNMLSPHDQATTRGYGSYELPVLTHSRRTRLAARLRGRRPGRQAGPVLPAQPSAATVPAARRPGSSPTPAPGPRRPVGAGRGPGNARGEAR
ncbi:polysaccharide biosynthesis tyrosine autokinase [Modestobacter sp. SSW1-42]|uniref:polysaccharide biosynthesis tyrosine autokinase n=1 Tax=Modestobacter sp. SSW1-42 TaxID=596372 RepID=UPI00398635BA